MVVQQNIHSLAELLVLAALDGPLLLRINAITTLTKFINQIQSMEDDSTRALFKLFQYFLNKGYLMVLLQKILPTNVQRNAWNTPSGPAMMSSSALSREEVHLFIATIHFFHSLLNIDPSSAASAMMEIGLVEYCCYSDYLQGILMKLFLSSSSSSSQQQQTRRGGMVNNSNMEGYYLIANEVFSFFVALLSSSTSSAASATATVNKEMIKHFLLFYQSIRELMTSFFHQPVVALVQLELMENIFSFVFILLNKALSLDGSSSGSSSNYLKLFQFLGKDLEVLVMDCVYLLQLFGKSIFINLFRISLTFFSGVKPFPSQLLDSFFSSSRNPNSTMKTSQQQQSNDLSRQLRAYYDSSSSSSSTAGDWWQMIHPSHNNTGERRRLEVAWQTSLLSQELSNSSNNNNNNNTGSALPANWSVFDQMKMEKSLEILSQLIAILRTLSYPNPRENNKPATLGMIDHSVVNRNDNMGLQFFPVSLLIHLFCEMSLVYSQLQVGLSQQQLSSIPSSDVNQQPPQTREERMKWMQSNQTQSSSSFSSTSGVSPQNYLQLKSLIMAENIVIIVYHLIVSKQFLFDRNKNASSLLGMGLGNQQPKMNNNEEEMFFQQFCSMASLYANHSFIRVVLRWIQEEITQQ
jgi:hypothetical protein